MLSIILLISLGAAEFKVKDMGELKVVWEREFDFPNYLYEIITDEKGNKKLAVGRGEVRFYDKSGKVIKKFEGATQITKNKKFIGLYRTRSDESGEYVYEGWFDLIDTEGNLLWSLHLERDIQEDVYLEEPPWKIIPSPNGKWAVGLPGAFAPSAIWILSSKGIVKKLHPYKDLPSYKTEYVFLDFTEEGDYCIISLGGWLLKYDSEGKEIWRKRPGIEEGKVFKDYIVGRGGDILRVFDADGNLLWERKLWLGSADFAIDESESILCVNWTGNSPMLFLYNMFSGELVWEQSSKRGTKIKFSPKIKKFIIIGGRGIKYLDYRNKIIQKYCFPENVGKIIWIENKVYGFPRRTAKSWREKIKSREKPFDRIFLLGVPLKKEGK